uniref:Uncharacterized protein n=1 Tax=Knipowitschia caucasica TaxID=637954 RepID=A0AAV2MRE0_KNICA
MQAKGVTEDLKQHASCQQVGSMQTGSGHLFIICTKWASRSGPVSPVSDQSRAPVTCSCVYCQHNPMLRQLGEQEKARRYRT